MSLSQLNLQSKKSNKKNLFEKENPKKRNPKVNKI